MTWITALLSSDWRLRRQATEAMQQRDDVGLALELVDALRLRHADINLLNAALRILETHRRTPVPALIALMQDPDPEVRIYVPLVLGELEDTRGVPALIAALQDPNENVRFNAVEALGKLHQPAAVDPLRQVLHSDTAFVRYAVVLALAAIGDPRPVAELLPLLADAALAEPVILALGQLGEPGAAAEVFAWVERTQGEIWLALEALTALERRFPDSPLLRAAFWSAAGSRTRQQLLRAAQALLQEDFSESPDPRPAQLALALGWIYQRDPADAKMRRDLVRLLGVPVARPIVHQALLSGPRPLPVELGAALDSPDRAWAHCAVRVLTEAADPAAMPWLLAALSSEDEMLASTAAEGLARLGAAEAVEPLFARLGDPSAQIRHAAVDALAALNQPALETRLYPLLNSPYPNEREAAIQLIARLESADRGLPVVLAALGDPAQAVRAAAVEALPRYQDPQIPSALAEALAGPDSTLRAAAARALAGLPPHQALPLLHSALSDSDAWVRLYACRSLGQLAQTGSSGPLIRATADPLPPVRIAAAQALARLGLPAVQPRLRELLEDPEPEVRETARRVLEQMRASTGAQ